MLLPHYVARVLPVCLVGLAAGVASGQDPSTGSGQAFPNKSIRIVTSVAGGGADFTARIVGQGVANLGQPVVVDNRPILLTGELVAKAQPDGYTLLVVGGSLWINPMLREMPYDVVRDFAPITLVERSVNLLVVHPSVAAKSVKELIALAKGKPGVLNYASSGAGGTAHLAAELFKSMAGVNIVHVPYKGLGPALTAVVAGESQLILVDVGLAVPHVKSGKLIALAVSSLEPSALGPGIPTIAASGVPGYEYVNSTGAWATAKTPAPIITRLNQEIVRHIRRPDVRERFLAAGVEPIGNTPEQFAAFIKANMAAMEKVIKDAGIKAD